MNKETAKQLIRNALSKKLGDGYSISIRQVLKTNQKLDGLTILQEGDTISPAVYLDPFYQDLENGISPDDVADRILRVYSETRMYPSHFDAASIRDFSHVRGRLYVALVNRHLNRELLGNIPHSLFLDDFAVTVRCLVETQEEETASFLVRSSHLDIWHIGQEELLALAVQNTRELLGIDLRNMKEVIGELLPHSITEETADTALWVMTNSRQLHGAATALFDDILKDFASAHGDFYAIFSSVHEVLLMPTSDRFSINDITEMNQEVNATQVREEEILGTRAYYYDKDRGFIL